MKNTLSILAGGSAIVSVSLAVMLFGGFRLHRNVQSVNEKLQGELRAAQDGLDVLRAENRTISEDLARIRSSFEESQARLLEANASMAAAVSNLPPVIPSYRANTFIGQTFLGQAWVIPHNVRMDTNTQRYIYDPVVLLDESLRNSLVVHHTNVVEYPVETQTSYNYNNTYYPTPIYYFGNPGYRPKPDPLPPTLQPPAQLPYPAPPAFNPGSGKVIPQKLGTPSGQIKTRQ